MQERAWARVGDETCLLGEGPVYDRYTDTVWWFDIPARLLHEYRLSENVGFRHQLPEISTALARIDGTRQLLVTETGLYIRNMSDGSLKLHHSLEADTAGTRSNDARVHPCGAFWVGTMAKDSKEGAGAIYWYRKGALKRLFADITVPNAICFSPDGRVGYFTDSPTRQIMQVPLVPETGLPRGRAIPFGEPSSDGVPDGAVVDVEGRLWVARWDGGGLHVYTPDGALDRKLAFPAKLATCPAFVGGGADRLLVTSASIGVQRDGPGYDEAGGVFITDLGTSIGRLEPDVVID